MNDLRFALRQLRLNPGFAAVALLTLALGIGANTAIFSVVNAVVLRPLPFPEPDRLVFASERSKDLDGMSVAYPNFLDWQTQQTAFTSLAAFRSDTWNLSGQGLAERLTGLQVSASFFETLGVRPMLGRGILPEDDRPGGARVVVVGEGLWRRRFGSAPDILGRTLTLDGQPHTVVGVMPASFQFPRRLEAWLPLGQESEWAERRDWHPGIYVVGRLRPDRTVEGGREDLAAVASRLAREHPLSNEGHGVTVMGLHERLAGPQVRLALGLLLGAVFFVLLIACTNVTHLLLSRAQERRREMAVRLALGAGRTQIFRQLLGESLLLSALGGVLGLLVAACGLELLERLVPPVLLEVVSLDLDARVLLVTVGASLLTGLVFGLAPAWHLAHASRSGVLKDGARGDSASLGRAWGRRVLIVGEVALALMLLVGAGLLLRSFSRLQAVPVGLEPAGVLTADLSLPSFRYATAEDQARFHRKTVAALRGIPGVDAAAVIHPLPLGLSGWQMGIRIEGEPAAAAGQARMTDSAAVSPDAFRVLGIPLLEGRAFEESDDGRQRVCIIDETFAQRHFPDGALGRRVAPGGQGTNWMTIVGVVGHVKNYGAGEESRIETYVPVAQAGASSVSLLLKTRLPPLTLSESVRQAVRSVDGDQPVSNFLTLEEVVARTVAERRLATVLLTLFAGLALLLAAVGLYGVLAFNVAQRTREFGIRTALGARAWDVLGLVLRQGGSLVVLGAVLGLLGAAAVGRVLGSLLFQTQPFDPATFVLTPLLVLAVGTAACLIPARRALRVSPTEALRAE